MLRQNGAPAAADSVTTTATTTNATDPSSFVAIGPKLAKRGHSNQTNLDPSSAIARSRGPQKTSPVESYAKTWYKTNMILTIDEKVSYEHLRKTGEKVSYEHLRKTGSSPPSGPPSGPPPLPSNPPPSDIYHGSDTAATPIVTPTTAAQADRGDSTTKVPTTPIAAPTNTNSADLIAL